MTRLQLFAIAVAVVACGGDGIAGPKPASPLNAFVKLTTTVAQLVLQRGDTARFRFSIENITGNPLTLTTESGCQIKPELDQVGGRRQSPPAGSDFIACPDTPTVRTLAAGEILSFGILLRAHDPTKPRSVQIPGYLLVAGVFDASVLVDAGEIGGKARSDWVRFEVK